MERYQHQNMSTSSQKMTRKKTIHFKGNAAGFFYYIGYGIFMRQHYHLENVCFSGCSSGAISASLLALDINFINAVIIPFRLQAKKMNKLALMGNWKEKIRQYLDQILPKEIDYKELRNLKIGILFLYKFKLFKKFDSREDVLECLLSSTHVPFFLDYKLFYQYRGKYTIDGDLFSRYKCPKETLLIDCDISIKNRFTPKTEEQIIQFILTGYDIAASDTALTNYLSSERKSVINDEVLPSFLSELNYAFRDDGIS